MRQADRSQALCWGFSKFQLQGPGPLHVNFSTASEPPAVTKEFIGVPTAPVFSIGFGGLETGAQPNKEAGRLGFRKPSYRAATVTTAVPDETKARPQRSSIEHKAFPRMSSAVLVACASIRTFSCTVLPLQRASLCSATRQCCCRRLPAVQLGFNIGRPWRE